MSHDYDQITVDNVAVTEYSLVYVACAEHNSKRCAQ